MNTYFNLRKNKLKEITQENKKIYVRINSQKSLYNSRQLNNSSTSLNHSRCSNASQSSIISRKSSTKGRLSKKVLNRQVTGSKEKMRIVEKKVDKLQLNEVNNYLRIFCNHTERNGVSPRTSFEKKIGSKMAKAEGGKENQNGPSALEKIVEEIGAKNRQRPLLPKLYN